jgi:uncharacterized protein YndB with AHSA1/START domain
MMAENDAIEVHGREVTATRIFDAPRALVWRAFTDPDHLKHWWGPNGFTCTFHEFDLRPGGAWNFIMHGPDGKDYENEWVFVAVDWMQRIVIDHTNFPRHRLTMRFEDVDGGKTKLTFQQVFESLDDYEKIKPVALPGLKQNLDRWAAHLPQIDPNRRELTIRRTFAAPRALVWQAWTDPKQLAKWWGPHGFTNPVCEIDLRPGGAIHIVMRAGDGTDYPMRGEFREIVPPERLVFTNYPVDDEGRQLIDGLTTVTFVEHEGTTEMTLQTRATGLSPIAINMIAGMAAGWGQSIERLAALVQSA